MKKEENLDGCMKREEFVKKYTDLVKLLTIRMQKAKKKGLLELEDDLDNKKILSRDIFEYGTMLAINGLDIEFIEEVLSNIVNQEKDDYTRLYKKLQSEAVYCIQQGLNLSQAYFWLNSFTDLSFNDDSVKKFIAGKVRFLFPKVKSYE